MPIYEWKRVKFPASNGDTRVYEYSYTSGSIHDPVPVPKGEGWVRQYNYQVGKVSEAGDSPSRSVQSQ